MATETIPDICQTPTSAARTGTSRQGAVQKPSSSNQNRLDKPKFMNTVPTPTNRGKMKKKGVRDSVLKESSVFQANNETTANSRNLEVRAVFLSQSVEALYGKVVEALHSPFVVETNATVRHNTNDHSQRYSGELQESSCGLSPDIASLFQRVRGEVEEIRALSSRNEIEKKQVDIDVQKVRLREQVESMISEFVAVDESAIELSEKRHKKLQLLHKYSIPKWLGKRKNGGVTAHEFLKRYYGHWIVADVIFKPDVRRMDPELVGQLREDCRNFGLADSLKTEKVRTELFASGVFGKEKEFVARSTLRGRSEGVSNINI